MIQFLSSGGIILPLLVMNCTIEFNDESMLRTIEIDNRPPARILCPHPKEREQEVLTPFSLGRRVGEGLPHFVRRAVQIHAGDIMKRRSPLHTHG